MKINNLLLLFALFSVLFLQAQIKTASILGDNMVLQRNSEVKLWGTSKPNDKLIIRVGWDKSTIKTTTDENGKWLVKTKTTQAGGPYLITIESGKEKLTLHNIMLGEVWLCSGQSNMEMPMVGFNDQPIVGMNDVLVDAENDNLRLFTVKRSAMDSPQDTCTGIWDVANAKSVGKFSAVGYLYARELQRKLNVPVGIICSSWGGTRIESWMSKEAISNFPISKAKTPVKPAGDPSQPSRLFNGMIHPILNFTIKGAIWYQGETNRFNANEYADLMTAMVNSWRSDFGVGPFPFYFVQIAPYNYGDNKGLMSANLREAQQKASLKIPNSGMISTVDIGEEKSIHPSEKITVAKRLSYWALSETYNKKGIAFQNPLFKMAVAQDSMMVITFDNTENGLTSYGKELSNFEIAGDNKVFYPAKASIVKKQIQVTCPEVKKPIAVRYCFCNYPQGKGFLYNTAGLPVPPFRSDDWKE
ncbi:MAG: sialate O-acetylesterase [Paludibacter sp.]